MIRLLRSALLAGFVACTRTIAASAQGPALEQQIEAGRSAVARGNHAEAESIFNAALDRAEKSGIEEPRLAVILTELGNVYRLANQPEKAVPPIRRALEILEKIRGPEDLEVAGQLTNLAGRLRDLKRFDESRPLLLRALAIREKRLPPDSTDLVRTLLGLASLYTDQEKYADAEPYLRRSLAILEKVGANGTGYPNVPDVLDRYAAVLHKLQRDPEAKVMELRAIELRAQFQGAVAPD